MACQCMNCKAIRALTIGCLGSVLGWLAWYITKMFIIVGWWAWNVTKNGIIVVGWWTSSAIKMFMSFLFVVFVIIIAVLLLICFISILSILGLVLLQLLETTRSNPNSIIKTLIIGGLGIDVGWWAWNVIKMFIIVVGWLEWSARKYFLIFLSVVFVIIIAVFLLICFISILFSLPPQTQSNPILEITITLIVGGFAILVGWWAWNITKILMIVFFFISLLYLFLLFLDHLPKSSPPPQDTNPHSKTEVDEQEQHYHIPDSAYDPQYDHDFTYYKGDDTNCTRGGYSYKRPQGWNRKAVKVIGKYEDDVWLGQKGKRDGSSPGEWPVSYHGTKIQNVPSIVVDGYDTKKCVRQMYGPGIYSSPDPEEAELFATDFNYKGEKCKCILQNRVNLKKTREVKTSGGIHFVTPDDGDIRPYGVCIKKI